MADNREKKPSEVGEDEEIYDLFAPPTQKPVQPNVTDSVKAESNRNSEE